MARAVERNKGKGILWQSSFCEKIVMIVLCIRSEVGRNRRELSEHRSEEKLSLKYFMSQ